MNPTQGSSNRVYPTEHSKAKPVPPPKPPKTTKEAEERVKTVNGLMADISNKKSELSECKNRATEAQNKATEAQKKATEAQKGMDGCDARQAKLDALRQKALAKKAASK